MKSRSAEPEEYEVPSQCIQNSEANSMESIPLEYEVPQSTPERRMKNSRAMPTVPPSITAPVDAPRRKNHAPNGVINQVPSADDEIHYEVPSTRYSTLSYPAIQTAISAPDPAEEPVSAPEGLQPHGYNSLPSKFYHKSHVYQTLEPTI